MAALNYVIILNQTFCLQIQRTHGFGAPGSHFYGNRKVALCQKKLVMLFFDALKSELTDFIMKVYDLHLSEILSLAFVLYHKFHFI